MAQASAGKDKKKGFWKSFKIKTFLGPEATERRRKAAEKRRADRLAAKQKRIETRKAPALTRAKGKAESGFWSPEGIKAKNEPWAKVAETAIGTAGSVVSGFLGGQPGAALEGDAGGDAGGYALDAGAEEGPNWLLIGGIGGGLLLVLIVVVVMMSGGKDKK